MKHLLPALFLALIFSGNALGQEAGGHGEEHESDGFHVDALRTWLWRDYLPNEDDATTLGLELDTHFSVGRYNVKNINYFELADYPIVIPGRPVGNEGEDGIVAGDTGFSDLLTGFWFTPKDAAHGKHHFSLGFAAQWATASDDSLGSGKFSLGPSFDYEYENGDLFAGFIVMQLWSVAGDSDRKDVNMMMVKPFAYYTLNSKWDLVYEPYGISVYWDKPSGEKLYMPLGGGLQRKFQVGERPMVASLQFLKYVERPTKGPEYDLRLLVEFDF